MNVPHTLSIPAGEAIGSHLRVKIHTGGKCFIAAAADAAKVVGHNAYGPVDNTVTGRDIVALQQKNAGICYAVAAEQLAVAAEFKGADGGKIQAVGGGTAEGVLLQAAAGDGSIVEVLYY